MKNSRKSPRKVKPDQAANEMLRRRRARTSLLEFTTYTMPGYLVNWHHELICQKLDQFVSGRLNRLMLFLPPRAGKSELGSRRLPAYILGKHPDADLIACSYSADLASRMNRDTQRIIDSAAYRRLFPETALSTKNVRSDDKGSYLRNNDVFEVVGRKGVYRCAGVGGGIMGMGFTFGIIDDPIKNRDQAESTTYRLNVWEWYATTFLTRQGPDARILIIMTRWHEDDLAGRLLKLQKQQDEDTADQWEVVSIPAIAGDRHLVGDPRQEGEPLWPKRKIFSLGHLTRIRTTLGARDFAALYQQSPIVEGGNFFREGWFATFEDAGKYWIPSGRSPQFKPDATIFITLDPAATEDEANDYTAIGVFAMTPINDLLVLEIIRERLGVEKIVPRLEEVCRQWNPRFVSVESLSFQAALVAEARRRKGMPPIAELSPMNKSKLSRATPAIIKAEAGQIFLPHSAGWKRAFLDELISFTGIRDAHDDQVDVLAYGVAEMARQGAGEVVGYSAEDMKHYSPHDHDDDGGRRHLFGM